VRACLLLKPAPQAKRLARLNNSIATDMKNTKYIAGLITILRATLLNAQIDPGASNTIGGTNSSVAGGNFNKCVAVQGFIGSGVVNTNTAYRGVIGGGGRNWAVSPYSTIPGGLAAKTRSYGQFAYASGGISAGAWGDSQFSLYVLRGSFIGDTTGYLTLDSAGGTEYISVPANGSFLFDIDVASRSTSVSNSVYGNFFHVKVAVENINGDLVCQELPGATYVTNHNPNLLFDYDCDADKFRLIGAGEYGNTVYWVATVKATVLLKP
jgi:hypothetical protein